MKKSILFMGVLGAFACNTVLKGENGDLTLTYTHGGLFESVDNSIAVGLMSDVSIRANSEGDVVISNAFSEDEGILLVESGEGHRLTLRSVSAGSVSLNVDTEGGLSDVFTLESAEIASVIFDDPITSIESSEGVHPVAGAVLG